MIAAGVVWLGAWLTTAHAEETSRGEAIYMANCMICHGESANGTGPAAPAMRPAPSDFTSADFWKDRTDMDVRLAVRAGRPGTSMMAFTKLPSDDLDMLIAYLRTKQPD